MLNWLKSWQHQVLTARRLLNCIPRVIVHGLMRSKKWSQRFQGTIPLTGTPQTLRLDWTSDFGAPRFKKLKHKDLGYLFRLWMVMWCIWVHLINSLCTYHMFIYFRENTRMAIVGNPPNTVNFRCFSVELYWLNHLIFYIACFDSMLEHVLNRWFNTTNMYFWPILTIQSFGQNFVLTRLNRVTVLQDKG